MKTVPRAISGVTVAATLLGSAAFLGAGYFARRIVVPSPTRKEDLQILRVFDGDDGTLRVELPASPLTRAPGRYSIWFAAGSGHACVGEVMDASEGTVTRVVERIDCGDLRSARSGIWSGYAYSRPSQLGLPYSHVEISVAGGIAPAWRFDPVGSGAGSMWAIHIHGMGGKRAGALRGVPVAHRLGFRSLVVSFRNDGEAPPSDDARYSLSQHEWLDVEAAVAYAFSQGAERVVLFGWSLGGSIALRLANLSSYSDRIAGLVLDAPVLDWATTLTSNGRANRLPKPVAVFGLRLLQSRQMRWVTGLGEPIELRVLDWVSRAADITTPVLVLHGAEDKSSPFVVSQRLAMLRPDLVQLVRFEVPGHSLEWNGEVEKWEGSVTRFLESLPSK